MKKKMIAIADTFSRVYFHIPSQELIDKVPATIQEYWRWMNEFIKRSPAQLPAGWACTWGGPYNWPFQAFIYLRAHGFPCELTASFPEEGIIFAHSDFLPPFLKPSAKQFIVELKPDRYLQCVFSNFVIVQNRHDPVHTGIKRFLIKSAFVHNWPQAGLIPRDNKRGERFENICFMGKPDEFLKDADLLGQEIKSLGLKWIMMPQDKWDDYSEVDAIVAVRPFDPGMRNRKPANKLTNAWLAGVPAILSPENAFEDLRQTELDYFKANNIPQIIESLKRLRDDPALRRAMVENAKRRAVEFTPERNVQRWIEIIEHKIIPEYLKWIKSPSRRILFFSMRILSYRVARIIVRVLNYLGEYVVKQKCMPWRVIKFWDSKVKVLFEVEFVERWTIGIQKLTFENGRLRFSRYKGVAGPVLTSRNIPDKGVEFVADPFLVCEKNRHYIFCEVLKDNKGVIGLTTSSDGKRWKYEGSVLEEPFHLSYPFIFRENGKYYMLPETHSAHSVRLYEADDFPKRWKYTRTLVTGREFVDPTLIRFQDKLWLFVGDTSSGELYLYYADSFDTSWQEHPCSPIVKGDKSIARPAGNLIRIGDRLIRLAQDDEKDYGVAVRAFNITRLNTREYDEEELSESPLLKASGKGWNKDGMHHLSVFTLNEREWLASVDGKVMKHQRVFVKKARNRWSFLRV